MESPEKVSSLERSKIPSSQSHINNLESNLYGGSNLCGQDYSYNSFSQSAPTYNPKFIDNYTNVPSHYASVNRNFSPLQSKCYEKPFGNSSSPIGGHENQLKSYETKKDYYDKSDSKQYSDGYSSSEYVTSTQKTPEGIKTNTYKYESYHSTPQPTYSSSSEKYFSSIPAAISPLEKKTFETFKNGEDSQYQSTFSTNVEYVNEPPIFKGSDTLEQKMLKKSVTQQIIEKKTVSMTKSTKQESATKNFRFE